MSVLGSMVNEISRRDSNFCAIAPLLAAGDPSAVGTLQKLVITHDHWKF